MIGLILSGLIGALIGAGIISILKVSFSSDWTNKEFDTTLLIGIGGFISVLVVVGCFLMHFLNPANSLLSPEIMMALIMMPSTIISYAMGKKSGETNAMTNGGQK